MEVPKKEFKIPDGFEFKTKPFEHQIEGFNYGLQYDRWLLGDEQGLGKTKQVIDIAVAKKLQKGYKHCLIICGVNGLKWNWVNEIHTHSNEDAWILGQRTKAGKTVIGSNADKLDDLNALSSISSYFLITNVESMRDEKIVAKIAKYASTNDIGIVAIDEIHKCKNPTSQQGKGILKIQPECRIAMTGTPLMNNPFDLFIILKWLGYEKHAFYAFKKHYGLYGGYGGYQVVGYRYLDELQAQLDEIMLRRLKKMYLTFLRKLISLNMWK
jgi:SNF2 family DNA or RNA helicase